jgi:hypothetical protein
VGPAELAALETATRIFAPNEEFLADGSSALSAENSVAELQGSTASGENEHDEDDLNDIEPKFKYERLLSDRSAESANILFRDSATTLAVHAKFLALGTKNGEIHVLDLQGNK